MRFVEKIHRDGDPSTRYKLALAGLEGNLTALRNEITRSTRVLSLLSERAAGGRTACHPYAKWMGAHWLLVTLADLGYPPGDRSLLPLRDQVLEWLLDPRRVARRPPSGESYLAPIVTIRGRPRVHASLEGNALYALLALGLDDARLDALADRLVELQWEDGGWNCDRAPAASSSSFEETLIPLRGLVWHARLRGNRASAFAAKKAAEVFLERRLFRRRSTGAVIARDFIELHYPCYWHYDILFGLKVLAEGGFIADARCDDAIALIRSKRRPDGGFPAEGKFWSVGGKGQRSPVSWGPTGKNRSNEFVTADALWVLERARRARSKDRCAPVSGVPGVTLASRDPGASSSPHAPAASADATRHVATAARARRPGR